MVITVLETDVGGYDERWSTGFTLLDACLGGGLVRGITRDIRQRIFVQDHTCNGDCLQII